MPDMSAQIKAQQDALKAEREADQLAQRDAEMKQAAAEAKRQQRRRRGRASLITRAGGSGSLGILDADVMPSYTGLKPLGSGTNIT
jgi:regulator of protease activity HflC (stomatin/prohibitin superfamily)